MGGISLIESDSEFSGLLRDEKGLKEALLKLYPTVNAKLIYSGGGIGTSIDRAKAFRALAVMDMLILKKLEDLSSRLSVIEEVCGLVEKSPDIEGPMLIDGVEISPDTHWSKIAKVVSTCEDPKVIVAIMESDTRTSILNACTDRLEELSKSAETKTEVDPS